jgi:hypothetical protein
MSSPTQPTGARGPGWALFVPVVAAALVAGFVAAHVSRDVPFDSDEANHANLALRQFQDLRDGRLADFLRHSYRTGQFPFLHGWTVLPSFALFGTTLFAARVAQCAAFVVGVAATGWAAFRASGGDRRAAAIGASLFAASPLLATYAGLCMLETPGAAATAVALAVFAEACRDDVPRGWRWPALVAAAALATYFVKLNYGLWVAPAIGLGYVVRWLRDRSRREGLRDLAIYAGTGVLVLAIWYSTQGQRAAFMGFLHNPSQAVSVESDDPTFHLPGIKPGNFAAYFGLVASDYHTHWIVGVAVFAAFVWGARHALRRPAVMASVACLLWTWLVLSMGFREYPLARFIATALPALWIVAAVGAADLLRRFPDNRWILSAATASLGLGLGALCARLPSALESEYEVGTEFVPVFDFLAGAVPKKASVLVVGYTDHTSARTLEWRLSVRDGGAWRDVNVVGLNSERIFESAQRFDDWMTKPRPWGAADWETCVVDVTPGPLYEDRDVLVPETVKLWHDAVQRYAPRLTRVAERHFDEVDVTVTVWRDTAPPRHLGLHGGE